MLSKRTPLSIIVICFVTCIVLEIESKRESACEKLDVVIREEWEARSPMMTEIMAVPVNHVIILSTMSPECHTKPQCIIQMQRMQDLHMDYNGWADLGYSFVIGGDGRVYESRGWSEVGAHTYNYNAKSIGVAFIGSFNTEVPNGFMLNATLRLMDCGVEKGYLTPSRQVHGHRDVRCSLTPGDALYRIIRNWPNYRGGRLPDYFCTKP